MQNESRERLRTAVFEGIGTASMCWEPTPTGVFDSTQAEVVGNKVMTAIEQIMEVEDLLMEEALATTQSTADKLRENVRQAHSNIRALANQPGECGCTVCLPLLTPEDSELLSDIINYDPDDDPTDLLSRAYNRLEELTTRER